MLHSNNIKKLIQLSKYYELRSLVILLPVKTDHNNVGTQKLFPFFLPFTAVVSCSLVCLWTLVACIVNNMDPDQTAPLGSSLIMTHSVCFHGERILECFLMYAADVISRQHFQDNKYVQNKG